MEASLTSGPPSCTSCVWSCSSWTPCDGAYLTAHRATNPLHSPLRTQCLCWSNGYGSVGFPPLQGRVFDPHQREAVGYVRTCSACSALRSRHKGESNKLRPQIKARSDRAGGEEAGQRCKCWGSTKMGAGKLMLVFPRECWSPLVGGEPEIGPWYIVGGLDLRV